MTSRQYICPGETHPISRGVHLSRLAAFYPACRECPFRDDTGGLPAPVAEGAVPGRSAASSLFAREGVRGRWLNELTRSGAAGMGAAFASLLWDRAAIGSSDGRATARRASRPAVVIAHDERPSAPDIAAGVAAGLRRWGCQVTDVGQVSGPCFRFAVRHLGAAGGVLITGSGCEPSTTGMEFALAGGAPVSRSGRRAENLRDATRSHDRVEPAFRIDLESVEERLAEPGGRPVRTAVAQRTFRASIPYEAGLRKHFHALRPLPVTCGSASPSATAALARLAPSLPCRVGFVELPCRARNPADRADPDVRRVSDAVRAHGAAIGVLIDDDARRCAFVDERGDLIPWMQTARLLLAAEIESHPRSPIVVSSDCLREGPVAGESLAGWAAERGARIIEAPLTAAAVYDAMDERGGAFGIEGDRFWLRDERPVCDAIVSLGKMLDALSQSDRPLSEVARHGIRN